MNPTLQAARRYVITGAVQGVGFRPFVYREAVARHLIGWIKNTAAGVEAIVAGSENALSEFEAALQTLAPFPARIAHMDIQPAEWPHEANDFKILASGHDGEKRAILLPDLATCPDCLREIRDPSNRRYRYPFTNCTSCGPRYSIMTGIPYDRARTTMTEFELCPQCLAEYRDPANRRFHAQPNACPACGPKLSLWDRDGRTLSEQDEALVACARELRNGSIVAVKGLGGFHLMVDATHDRAVRQLRTRKGREEKPLAVMVPTLEQATLLADISPLEQQWLGHAVAPIVLVRKKASSLSDAIAPANPRLGLFLPYTPLHHLLLAETGLPLVATSGNLRDEPICTREQEALDRLRGIADFFLIHDRPIAHPVDDSVVRIVLDRPLILRAARGLAPISLDAPRGPTTLGVGAHMKATVALGHEGQIVVSPHIGDLESVEAQEAYTKGAQILKKLYEVEPAHIACDLHPNYATTHFAEKLTPTPIRVQHHVAHVLAVVAEYGLRGPVLGVVWDGTGYGDDGTIWGGEFLRVNGREYERVAHLRRFPLPGGDAAAREPRRSALGVLHEMGVSCEASLPFSISEQTVLNQAMDKRINTAMTSSAGRLFDAAAALLGLCQKQSYEGQAAMMLQAEAEQARHDQGAYVDINDESDDASPPRTLDWRPIVEGIIADRLAGVEATVIAARFHESMANVIVRGAGLCPDIPIVLAGGCFQNALLLERAVEKLQAAGRAVYWPRLLPPNDGAISVGQVMAGLVG